MPGNIKNGHWSFLNGCRSYPADGRTGGALGVGQLYLADKTYFSDAGNQYTNKRSCIYKQNSNYTFYQAIYKHDRKDLY